MRHMMVVFYWQVEMAHINRVFACPYPKHSRSASLCFLCSLLRMHCVSLHPALRALNFVPRGTFVQLRGEERGFGEDLSRSYEATGLMALFPVYLERAGHETDLEAVNSRIAQNENNLNQNLTILYDKLLELEAALAARE